MLWRESKRGMEREKSWIDVWMRETEREGREFVKYERERVGEQ